MPIQSSGLVIDRATGVPTQEEKAYRPYGAALELMYAKEPEILIEGPSGTGKSRSALEKLHLCASKYPRMRGAIVRKTRESLTQSVLVTYETKVLPERSPVKFWFEDQEYRYPNGSILTVAGMDKDSRIMSSDYDMIYVAEATEILESDAEVLTTRLRNNMMPYQQLIMDCNPAYPGHWLNQRCIKGITRRLLSRHEDNPSITPAYIAKLDALTGYRYQRLRLGLWVAAEGQFFEEWDESKHIVPAFDIPPDWTRWVAIDYGFADPFCALWFARDPHDRKHIYVYRESYGRGLRDEQQAAQVKYLCKDEKIRWFVGDPSMFNRRTEQNKPSIAWIYAKQGCKPMIPGVNERIAGWQTVRRALAHDADSPPRLQILKGRAPNLVRTLPAMVYDPLDSEDLADKLNGTKTEDHACLVGNTPVTTQTGLKSIRDVRVGDIVMTRQGWKPVTDWAMTSANAPVLALRLSNGQTLIGTGNHPIWIANNGFVRLDTLRYGDILLPEVSICEAKQSYSTASGSGDIQSLKTGRRQPISVHLEQKSSAASDTCTGRFGKRRMGQYRTATTFITRTAIRLITILLTWWPNQPPSTFQVMPTMYQARRRWSNWQEYVRSLLRGMAPRLAYAGTPSMGRMSLGTSRYSHIAANSAMRSSKAGSVLRCDSVQTDARVHGDEPQELIMETESAQSVGKSLLPTDMINRSPARGTALSVLGVCKANNAPVYNITVQDAHEYFAQGVLVSNCDCLRYGLVFESMPDAQTMKMRNFLVKAG